MRQHLRPLALVLALALLGACSREPPVYEDRLLVFGTLVEITLYGADAEQGAAAARALKQQLEAQHREWHPWQPGPLAELNAALADGQAAATTPEIAEMTRRSQALSIATEGLFNPAIGNLIELWGFHRADQAMPAAAPAPEAVAAVLARAPRMEDLTVQGSTVASRNPAVRLDFGAFAKGYAVEKAIETLRALGVDSAIVNAGGDLKAIGRRGERPWRIGIRHPRGAGVLAGLEVADGESVFTSGDYERFFELDGRRYHHVLDPRSGQPAPGIASVTVVHPDAAVADAAATAVMVAGPQAWPAVARALKLRWVMVIESDGAAQLTPAMAERIQFEPGAVPIRKIVPL